MLRPMQSSRLRPCERRPIPLLPGVSTPLVLALLVAGIIVCGMGMTPRSSCAREGEGLEETYPESTPEGTPPEDSQAPEAAYEQQHADEQTADATPAQGAPAITSVVLLGDTGSNEVCASPSAHLSCEIAYEGLTPLASYQAAITLKRADEHGEPVSLAANDKPQEVSFTAEAAQGSVLLTCEADLSSCAGSQGTATVVLCDAEGTLVASYQNLDDEAATIRIPKVAGEATDAHTGLHTAPAEGELTIADTLSYSCLTPGESYVAVAEYHACAKDGSDAGPLTDKDGNPLKSTQEFTPDAPNGTVSTSVSLDAAALKEPAIVAYSHIKHGDVVVASHKDVSDTHSAVALARITTELVDAADKDHAVATGKARLVDTVSYRGLTPQVTYTLVGTLHKRAEDGTDGGVLTDENGNPLTVSHEFVAKQSDGSETVEFELPQTLAAGTTIVAFEQLKQNSAVVARHEDIASDKQSVRVEQSASSAAAGTASSSGERMPQTGRLSLGPILMALGGILFAGGIVALARGRRTGGSLGHTYRRRRHYAF